MSNINTQPSDYETAAMPKDFDKIAPLGSASLSKQARKQLHDDAEHYILRCVGDGMSPEIKAGENVLIEALYPQPGEAGVIWRNGKPLTIMYITGNYLTPINAGINVSPVIYMAAINPIKHYSVTGDKIDTLHRVVGVVRKNGSLRRVCLFEKYRYRSPLKAAA